MDEVRHDWTFLLNNDMTLHPFALSELMALRETDVFAVGSQIFQKNAEGRREETGLTDWYTDTTGFHLYHAPILDDNEPFAHLCVSGGAGLFRTELLRRYVREARDYDPFYWEDVEWSVRAWRDGMLVLFCPRSRSTGTASPPRAFIRTPRSSASSSATGSCSMRDRRSRSTSRKS
jgi:GT2 family glycosyltransferase